MSVEGKFGYDDIDKRLELYVSESTAKDLAFVDDLASLANTNLSNVTPGSVSTSLIANGNVTLDKLAPGTPGKIIGYNQSGNPAELEDTGLKKSDYTIATRETQIQTSSTSWTDSGLSGTVNFSNLDDFVRIQVSGNYNQGSTTGIGLRVYNVTTGQVMGSALEYNVGVANSTSALSLLTYTGSSPAVVLGNNELRLEFRSLSNGNQVTLARTVLQNSFVTMELLYIRN